MKEPDWATFFFYIDNYLYWGCPTQYASAELSQISKWDPKTYQIWVECSTAKPIIKQLEND